RDGPYLAHEPGGRLDEVVAVLRLHEGRLKAAERVDHRGQDGHRGRVRREAVEVMAHVLVDQLVLDEQGPEVRELGRRRQLAEDQEVGRLDEGRLHRELLDRIAAVAQDAATAVYERDRALARPRVGVAAVERDEPRARAKRGDVDGGFVLGSDDEGQVDALAVVAEGCGLAHHEPPKSCRFLRLNRRAPRGPASRTVRRLVRRKTGRHRKKVSDTFSDTFFRAGGESRQALLWT